MSPSNPKPLWKRLFGGFAYGFVCFFALGAGTVSGYVQDSPVAKSGLIQFITGKGPQEAFGNQDVINLLILGCDEDRAYGGKTILKQNARSDMILVTRLDFKNKRISGVSIPRDTLVEVPGYREQKINAYHVLGGTALAKQAVETAIGVPIDRVAVINYKAFQEMVDLVGGVEVFIDKKMKYTDKRGGLFIDFKPGRQKLDGYNAMCFVRYRHGDSDFKRQDRQKEFLLSFKDSLTNRPSALNSVAEKAKEVLGTGLTDEEVAALALFARKISNDNIKMGMVPTVEAGHYNLAIDNSKLRTVLKQYHFLDGMPMTVSRREQ